MSHKGNETCVWGKKETSHDSRVRRIEWNEWCIWVMSHVSSEWCMWVMAHIWNKEIRRVYECMWLHTRALFHMWCMWCTLIHAWRFICESWLTYTYEIRRVYESCHTYEITDTTWRIACGVKLSAPLKSQPNGNIYKTICSLVRICVTSLHI